MVAVLHGFTTGAHQASCTMGNRSFPGVKKPGMVLTTHPPSIPKFKKRRELYLYSLSVPSWQVIR